MRLAPYASFGQLRLAKWFPNEEFLEGEDSYYRIIQEQIRGVTFMRSMEHPDQTFSIELDLWDFVTDLRQTILDAVQLPVEAGTAPERLKGLFGEPEAVKVSRLDRTSWMEFRSSGPEPYLITCVFKDDKGLSQLTVQRLDIPFPLSEEELDSPPSEHRWLDTFEVLPENVTSPESPVSRVSVNMQSSGNFWYRIHLRLQNGITVLGASLHIKRPDSGHVTTTIWLRPPTVDSRGHMEMDGYLDKDLVRLAHVRLTLQDEAHHTSQDVIVEFDRFWGKAPPRTQS